MDITVIEQDKKKGTLSFVLKGASPAFANTLRRNITDNVPTMAIEMVEFRKNSSALYDEMIAHRLGLIPLTTDLKSYNLPSECKCEGKGCARCQLALTLSAKGPGVVYSSSLKSKDPKVKPVFENIPIVKLLKGQEIEFEATASLGTGRDHTKWCPGLVHYTYFAKVTVKNDPAKLEEFRTKYPPQIFGKDGKIDKNLIIRPSVIDACEGVCDDLVKIERADDAFMFYIESWGQLGCKEILSAAFDVFDKQLDQFSDQVKEVL